MIKPLGRKAKRSRTKATERAAEKNRMGGINFRTRHSQDVGIAAFELIGRGPKNRKRRIQGTESLEFFAPGLGDVIPLIDTLWPIDSISTWDAIRKKF